MPNEPFLGLPGAAFLFKFWSIMLIESESTCLASMFNLGSTDFCEFFRVLKDGNI